MKIGFRLTHSYGLIVILIPYFLSMHLVFAQECPSCKEKAANAAYFSPGNTAYTPAEIKNKLKRYPRWLAYKAFREKDTLLCDTLGKSSSECLEVFNRLKLYELLSEGKCNSLPYQYREFQDVCEAVNKTECSLLPGYKKDVCEALLKKDVNIMIKAFSDFQFPMIVTNKKDKAEEFINIYYGFKNKNKSERECNRFTTGNLLLRASCNMLFGNHDFENRLDSISEDIANAWVAKKSADAKSCANIKNAYIKEVCQDSSIEDFDDILHAVWD